MGMLSRMSTIVKSKMNRILDNAEDPRETLDYSYEKQLEMLRNVKRGVVEMVAAKRQIQQQADKVRDNVARLERQAEQAVDAGREDLALLALERKHTAVLELEGLDQQIAGMEVEQEKLTQAEARLSAKVAAFQDQERGHQGPVHGGPGPGAHRRRAVGHLRGDGRRRPCRGAGREQDREHAGPRQRHRRAGQRRSAGRRRRRQQGRHHPRAGKDGGEQQRRDRTGRPQGAAQRERAMIVRISSEGQYNLPGSFIDRLNEIDNALVEAVAAEDQAEFETLLKRMLDLVRDNGEPVPVDELVESDLILPEPDLTLLEAEELFVGEGLLPG